MHTHRDKAISMTEEKPLQRRHSHNGHILPSPASVIDQLKTKVKRRRLSKNNSFDLIDNANVSNLNGSNYSSPRSSQDQTETSSVTLVSYRTITPATLETIISYDGNDQETTADNNIFVESNEDYVFSPSVTKEEEKPLSRNESALIDLNQKLCRTKPKSLKATKSLPETNMKKRRQTHRRTGFQIRDEDFYVIFNDLPSDEQLIIGLPCAWRKEVFMHGRIFLTINCLYFYTCFFKWEESLRIPFKDIVSVTREKSAVVFANAIKIRTTSNENYLFASSIPREQFFITVFRLWQNALLEQPLDFQQLRTLVHADQPSIDESTGESDGSINLENPSESLTHSESLPLTTEFNEKTNRRVISLPSDSDKMTYLSTCPCESHLSKVYAEKSFTLNVDKLFELFFVDNSFTQNYHASQNLNDYNYGEWQLNKETGFRERLVTYKTTTQAIIGSISLICREKQILKLEKSGSAYVLYSEVNNEGMKYTDKFFVATQFCMIQKDFEHSFLRISAEIRYIKNVNGIIKNFIEKNAYSTIEEQINEQIRRIEAEQTTLTIIKKPTSILKQQTIDSTPPQSSRFIETKSSNFLTNYKSFTGKGFFYDLFIFIIVFVFFLHVYLCYKFYVFNQKIQSSESICFSQCREKCLLNHQQ